MNGSLLTVLPTVLRPVRYPTSGLAAVLAVIADQAQSTGVAVIARSCDDGPAELLGVGGSAAGTFGRLGPVEWADDRFNRSGREVADPVGLMPWEPGNVVVWDSMGAMSALSRSMSKVTAGSSSWDTRVLPRGDSPTSVQTVAVTMAASTPLPLSRLLESANLS